MFYLQIAEAQTGRVAVFADRRLEVDFVEACVQAIASKGVGLLRTEAQVRQAIREGLDETIRGLKDETKALV